MLQKLGTVLLLSILLIHGLGMAYGEEVEQSATIYYESVHVNGAPLNTMDSDYPLLNYKGVTYIPLTWQVNRHMGMVQEWDDATQTLMLQGTTDFEPIPRKFESNYYGSGEVGVNLSEVNLKWQGLQIEFGEYPLLEYNHVQYIPLTWDFISGKLGWDLRWNTMEGLVLNRLGAMPAIYDERRFKAFASFMQTQNKDLSDETAMRYTRLVMDASDKYGIDDTWVMAVFWQESYYDASCYYGGAYGAMQIMESTGRSYGLNRDQLLMPEINIDFGVRYLSGLRSYYEGDLHMGTLAYNQGTLRVNRGTSRTWYIEDVVEKQAIIIEYVNNFTIQ